MRIRRPEDWRHASRPVTIAAVRPAIPGVIPRLGRVIRVANAPSSSVSRRASVKAVPLRSTSVTATSFGHPSGGSKPTAPTSRT